MPALTALLAYLLGSLSFGILYSRARGGDVRDRDMPGGSGIYRQYGLAAALLVVALDIGKGALAASLALALAPDWTWLAVFAVVLGHNYPVFFRFDGGGGIAPLIGALLVVTPLPTIVTLAVAFSLMPLYKRFLQSRLRLNVIPVATALALPVGMLVAARQGGLPDLFAGALAMAVRAVHLLRRPT